MLSIKTENILTTIGNAPFDPAVGIQLALPWEETDKSYYGTLIASNKRVAAHYHNESDELYFIVSGNGFMRLGIPLQTGIEWEQEFEVQNGDIFTVPSKTVHQLINKSDENLIAIFGCKKSHLESDRFIV